MSSRYVRQIFEGWLADAAMTVPFYPTINMEQNPSDQIWCTADFATSYRQVLTFCNGSVSEDGEVEVVYFAPPGQGYDAVLQALEADMTTLLAKTDPNGKVTITGRSGPIEFSDGSADQNYSLSCFVEYQYFE